MSTAERHARAVWSSPRKVHSSASPRLQQLATADGRLVEHRTEHPVEGLDELLGTDAATSREALGESCEPGDVGEDESGVDRLPLGARCLVVPLEGHSGT